MPSEYRNREVAIIMTRQKKLYEKQMQSLIIGANDCLIVSQFFVDQIVEDSKNVYSKVGEPRGSIIEIFVDYENKIHILCEGGIYQQYRLAPRTNNTYKLDGPTVDI